MSTEINHLGERIVDTKNDDSSLLAQALDNLGKRIASLLPAPANILGNVMKVVSSLFKKK